MDMKPANRILACVLGVACTLPASANMGGTATNHGLLPHDLATAQALSLFGEQASTAFYNPAGLTRGPQGELTGGLLHGERELRAESLGGPAPMQRDGDVLNASRTQQVLLGMKTDLNKLTVYEHPIYFGFLLSTEKFSRELLAFNARTSKKGQFLQYGRQPLFLTTSLGTQLWRGIDFGAGLRVLIENKATLRSTSDLAGNTSNERLTVAADPVVSPVFGLNIGMGDTFCSYQDCWLDPVNVALGFRRHTRARLQVDTRTEIPGTITNPGLELAINAIDSYTPDVATLGVEYSFGDHTRVGLTGEYQRWSALETVLEDDDIRDQARARFDDVVVPRLGLEHEPDEHWTLKTGLAWQESPLASTRTPDVNFLDTDKWTLGLGASLDVREFAFLAHPVRFDLAYQYQHLVDREFELTSTSGSTPQPYERVRADGEVHVFSASVTMKFGGQGR